MASNIIPEVPREKTFENKVKRFIEQNGGWQVKFFANNYTRKGIPDILACINGHFVAIEVKAQTGNPSALQLHQITQIRKTGGFAFVLYPSAFERFKQFVEDLKKDKYSKENPVIWK